MGACEYFLGHAVSPVSGRVSVEGTLENLKLPSIIKEIGRGKHAAGDLSREDAQALFSAILAGRVPELELGGILIALRVKGETLDELAGFAAACEASYAHLAAAGAERSAAESKDRRGAIPVVVPSYNGARALPNLVPLLALLLAREGIPVLIHGVTQDPGRVTTVEVLQALGITAAASAAEAASQLESHRLSFLPIDVMAPAIARVLSLRSRLGVRNSAHTLAKMLQPFSAPALRIVSVTHPEYLARMREYFTTYDSDALLVRGAEGEAVAHPRREPAVDWAHGGAVETWTAARAAEPELPYKDADATARWTEAALQGQAETPAPIIHQVECCKRALAALSP